MPEEPQVFSRPDRLTLGGKTSGESEINWLSELIGQSRLKHPTLIGETVPCLVIYNPHMGTQVVLGTDETQVFMCNAITSLAVELTALKTFTQSLVDRIADLDDPLRPAEEQETKPSGGLHIVKDG